MLVNDSLKKIGYKQYKHLKLINSNEPSIKYIKMFAECIKGEYLLKSRVIEFIKKTKKIRCWQLTENQKGKIISCNIVGIDVSEINAIFEKCNELGWIKNG